MIHRHDLGNTSRIEPLDQVCSYESSRTSHYKFHSIPRRFYKGKLPKTSSNEALAVPNLPTTIPPALLAQGSASRRL